MNLTVHHLRFTLRAATLVHFGPQAGAQIRGALWAALRRFACTAPSLQHDPEHTQHCPMCRLMALESGQSARGSNPPRPFAIRPPLAERPQQDRIFYPQDTFRIGVNLFGDVADLFPYVFQAFQRMGEGGVGYGRGRFTVEGVEAYDPLTGETMPLLRERRFIVAPGLPLSQAAIERAAQQLPANTLRLRFLTPTQIKQRGQMLNHPTPEALIARLLERCQALELHYTDRPTPQADWRERYLTLTEAARGITLAEDRTRWVRVQSGSRRTHSRNTIGGFVGTVTFRGDLRPFREWLLWGQSLHVGKNVVKGNGWYEVVEA